MFPTAGDGFCQNQATSYYRARYYDPSAGRFLSEDLIGFLGGLNTYLYAENRPVLLSDPTGLCPSPDPGCRDRAWAHYEQSKADALRAHMFYPIKSTVTGAVSGAVTGCLFGAEVGCIPGAAAGVIVGAFGGALEGIGHEAIADTLALIRAKRQLNEDLLLCGDN
jgi:RHS repeat-associated protein